MSSIIQIIDDEPSSRATIAVILEGQDYQLEFAANGHEALSQAEEVIPDLVLLDVMMPGMNGFEVCERLRANPRLREVPILLLTALDDRESRMQGLQAGADDFLSKPVDSQELRTRVATITRLNRYRTMLQQREELKRMAERVIQAQEQERLFLSREIHDDIGQALTIQQMSLQQILDSLPAEQDSLRQAIGELVADSKASLEKLRLIVQNLRPPLLETLSVPQALKAYSSDFSRRTGLPVHFEADEAIPTLPDQIGVTLYRVLQEALSNIVHHAEAGQAWITLHADDEEVCLTVQDNGKGSVKKDWFEAGHGLQGLRERVTMAGGAFYIHSAMGYGTIITVRFPNDLLTSEEGRDDPSNPS